MAAPYGPRNRVRYATEAEWTAANPTPKVGEIAFSTDVRMFKVGDGATSWTGLSYTAGGSGSIPAAHHTTHENDGSDEISVAGLSGLLADPQTPLTLAGSGAPVSGGGGTEAARGVLYFNTDYTPPFVYVQTAANPLMPLWVAIQMGDPT